MRTAYFQGSVFFSYSTSVVFFQEIPDRKQLFSEIYGHARSDEP